jgi:hypothetical protein
MSSSGGHYRSGIRLVNQPNLLSVSDSESNDAMDVVSPMGNLLTVGLNAAEIHHTGSYRLELDIS